MLEEDVEEDDDEFVEEEVAAGEEIDAYMDYDDVMEFVDDEFHSDEVLNHLEEINAEGINFVDSEEIMDEIIGDEQISGGVEKIVSPNADFCLVHCLE